MHDQHEWEALLHFGQTVGPMHPRLVPSAWGLLLTRGVEQARLHPYAVLAGGSTVYLLGPHPGDLPRGFALQGGWVSLDGADERGQRVRLGGLPARLVEMYLYVSDRLGSGPGRR